MDGTVKVWEVIEGKTTKLRYHDIIFVRDAACTDTLKPVEHKHKHEHEAPILPRGLAAEERLGKIVANTLPYNIRAKPLEEARNVDVTTEAGRIALHNIIYEYYPGIKQRTHRAAFNCYNRYLTKHKDLPTIASILEKQNNHRRQVRGSVLYTVAGTHLYERTVLGGLDIAGDITTSVIQRNLVSTRLKHRQLQLYEAFINDAKKVQVAVRVIGHGGSPITKTAIKRRVGISEKRLTAVLTTLVKHGDLKRMNGKHILQMLTK